MNHKKELLRRPMGKNRVHTSDLGGTHGPLDGAALGEWRTLALKYLSVYRGTTCLYGLVLYYRGP